MATAETNHKKIQGIMGNVVTEIGGPVVLSGEQTTVPSMHSVGGKEKTRKQAEQLLQETWKKKED